MRKHIALVLAASAMFLLAGCRTTSHATKWEYKQVEMASEADLNALANQGWSFVCATTSTRGTPLYILKRAKR